MNTAQRILKNFLSLSGAEVITNLLGFVVVVYLARILGPGDFGKINFAFAIIIFFILFSNLGLNTVGIRELARNKKEIKEYTGNVITLKLCLGLLAFTLLLLFVIFLNKPLQMKYLIILYGLTLFPSVFLFDWVFQGMEKMEYIATARIIGKIFYIALIFLFIKSSRQLLLIPGIWVLTSFITSGFLIVIFIKHFGRIGLKFDILLWKRLIPQALPIGFALIVAQIFYTLDTIMLGFMRSNEEVGYYNAAYKIILFIIMLVGAYYAALFPIMSNYYKKSLDLLKRLLSQSSKLMAAVALPLIVGGIILAKPIMNLFYGVKYAEGIIAFQILIWAVAIIYMNTGYSRGLLACDRQNRFIIGVVVPAIVNIVLNFILIPPLGLVGAAIATVIAEGSGFIVMYIEFGKVVQVPFYNYMFKPLLASILMGIFLYLGLNWNIFLLISGGFLIYLASLYLMRGITKEEVRLVYATISRSRK